jgi:hypothetical protein
MGRSHGPIHRAIESLLHPVGFIGLEQTADFPDLREMVGSAKSNGPYVRQAAKTFSILSPTV